MVLAEPGRRAWGREIEPETEGPEVGFEASAGRLFARPRPAPLPGSWTFWADTIVGSSPLGQVQLADFNCVRRLSGFGTGTARIVLPSAIEPERLLRLWSWRLWAYYEGQPYWCGVPTGIEDAGGPVAAATLTEVTSYLFHRQWDYASPQRFNQVEQTQIARQIAQPLEDVGVVIETRPGPGFPRDREYAYLESESRGRLLENLSNVISGPEFVSRCELTYPQGRPRVRLVIGYPRVGGADSGLGLTVPGDALGYGAAWDSDAMRTRTFAAGDVPEDAPEGTPKPVVVEDRPQADLPRLDAVDDYPGTILVSTLTERAKAMASKQAQPALQLRVSASEQAPPLLDYGPGDDVTVSVTSMLLPGGLEVPGRLTEIEVAAATGRVTWTVVIELPPPRARPTLSARLAGLDHLTRGAFRTRLAPVSP